ncbi:phytoene/squalene synthase family protein [Paenibacillus soyae]|uniref:Phytoene/squalene synthase family protein n=1 Tax=Paenibacillus soyae TaxID=2969249 RepID=A0A9X2MU04_9BACL|nr:phytoene/squalene synthase family protein [Paenibacillus soyae]MCR2806799.1 phytoene/squalene synthase family protein [Paenibacillus soyae]
MKLSLSLPLHKPEGLEADYRYCEEIIKQNSRSFYYAFLQLPREKANAVFAIYAYCRLADDAVDRGGSKEESLDALHVLERQLLMFAEGREIDHPLWRALRDVFTRYDMRLEPFYEQLVGQKMDLFFSAPATMDELETYSYYVAGSVGLMLLPIIASGAGRDMKQAAVRLGTAMQITNILRDVGEDAARGRIYLPSDLLASEGYGEIELRRSTVDERFIRVWEKLARRAENLYDAFVEDIAGFDEDSRFQVLLSAQIYRGILNAVRQNGYDCYTKRNAVSKLEMRNLYNRAQKQLSAISKGERLG